MKTPCPYCKGSLKFRHERPPNITDVLWYKMVGQAARCPLCKGVGFVDRPIDSLIIDSGLIYVKNNDKRVLVACPTPACVKWLDATDAFQSTEVSISNPTPKVADLPQKTFVGKCSEGHEITIDIVPMGRGLNQKGRG